MDEIICQYISADNNLNAVIECMISAESMKGKMNSKPHKRITDFFTEDWTSCIPPWRLFCQPEERTTHAYSCLVIYVCTHVRGQKTTEIYSFLSFDISCFSLLLLLPVLLSHPPRLSRHSCREQSNDACLSETWWIVMNQACVSIWGEARERQREGTKDFWVRRKRGGGCRLWVKTGLFLRHWCSTSSSGDWQAIQLH